VGFQAMRNTIEQKAKEFGVDWAELNKMASEYLDDLSDRDQLKESDK